MKIIFTFIVLIILCATSFGADLKSGLASITKDQKGIVILADFNSGERLFYNNNIDNGRQKYAPGSIIKLFLAMLMIEKGIDNLKVNCYASSPTVPIEERCWYTPGHGMQDFSRAFANSCNRYFMTAATKLNGADFKALLYEYGLFVPTDIAKLDHNDMIGLGDRLLVNPEHIFSAYMAVLNGGALYRWWFDPHEVKIKAEVTRNIAITRKVSERLKELMVGVTTNGTAMKAVREFDLPPFPAKTGTAYYKYKGKPDIKKTHGWFIAVYPKYETEIALLVFVLEGKGSIDAATLGARIINEYQKK